MAASHTASEPIIGSGLHAQARYRLSSPAFIAVDGSSIPAAHAAGAEVMFGGVPDQSMVPISDEARRAKARTIPTTWDSTLNDPQHRQIGFARSLGIGEPRDAAHALELIEAFRAEHSTEENT